MSVKSRRGPRVLVVYKKSAFEIYVRERRNTRVQELLEAGDAAVRTLKRAHEEHRAAMDRARQVLQKMGAKATFRYRAGPASQDEFDLVMTLGGDGTLLWASHLTGAGQPVLAINTAPNDSVGYFCAGDSAEMEGLLEAAFSGQLPELQLARMRVTLDDECISNRVLNDVLFAHSCPAATTRFSMKVGGESYDYKCSGLWVGPAAGSTAAQRSAGGEVLPIASRDLQFVVRELYQGASGNSLPVRGLIRPGEHLSVVNLIRAGRLFVDGPHQKSTVDIGSTLTMTLSDEPLTLLGFGGG